MATNRVDYNAEKGIYYKILFGLLLLTAVTFVQPHFFMVESTFLAQMIIAVIKGWMIVMYYMHLKGETLIGMTVVFALFLVAFFFIIVIGVDVPNFQFGDESFITTPIANGSEHVVAPAHH